MSQALYELYDSDEPLAIPLGVKAAGYDDGYAASAWTAYGWARFPDALHITVFGLPDSDVFDIETGDGTPAQAGAWAVQRKARRKIAIPYCERVNGHAVEDSLRGSGVAVTEAMLWIATDDGTEMVTHWPDGTSVTYPVWAVQYLNEAHGSGGHYDRSLVYLAFGGGGGSITGKRRRRIMASSDNQNLFMRGPNNDLLHNRYDPKSNSWSGWLSLGGILVQSDVEVTGGGQRLDIYVVGGGNQIYHTWSDDAGATWPTSHGATDNFQALGGDASNGALVAAGPGSSVVAPPAAIPTNITLDIPSVPGTATGKLS